MDESQPSSTEAATTSGEATSRQIVFGEHTATCLMPDESTVLAIDLRYRTASRRTSPESNFNTLASICEDALVALVPDEDDIDRIITELAARRIGPQELLELLLGVEANNRDERRHPPAAVPQAQRAPRRRNGRRR